MFQLQNSQSLQRCWHQNKDCRPLCGRTIIQDSGRGHSICIQRHHNAGSIIMLCSSLRNDVTINLWIEGCWVERIGCCIYVVINSNPLLFPDLVLPKKNSPKGIISTWASTVQFWATKCLHGANWESARSKLGVRTERTMSLDGANYNIQTT